MNRAYSRLKQRLESAEAWTENFLEVERHKEISKKALHEYYKQKPILSFFFRLYVFPTVLLDCFYSIIWWNRYYRCCKEIEIMRKEIKIYEQN